MVELLATSGVEIDTSTRRLAEYSYDASNYPVAPLGVVFPRDAGGVSRVAAICHHAGIPIIARGGGTSMAGNAIGSGVVLDLSRYMIPS
jgi:FAD/FMN-containing dehydrogenase